MRAAAMRWLRDALHVHRWVRGEFVTTGFATLSWSCLAVREWGYAERCASCGSERNLGGYVVPGDPRHHPEAYGQSGWPITDAGERMPVVPDVRVGHFVTKGAGGRTA